MSAYFVPLYGHITWEKFFKTHKQKKCGWKTMLAHTKITTVFIRAMQLISKFGVLSQWACYLISAHSHFGVFFLLLYMCFGALLRHDCHNTVLENDFHFVKMSLKLRLILFQWKSVKNHNSTFCSSHFSCITFSFPCFCFIFLLFSCSLPLNKITKYENSLENRFNTCTTCVMPKSYFSTQCVDFHLKFFLLEATWTTLAVPCDLNI